MDFYELEAFVALANALHFARAAAAVHTSPSGLSRLLGRLEEELGVRLAERDTRRVELTEEGRAFLDFATDSLRRRDELRLGLGSRDGMLRGFLRVYASVTACYSVLPPFAEALVAEHPELSLSVETGDPAEADDAARTGRVELAVAAIPDGGFSDLDSYAVRRSPLVLVASRSGPWGRLDLELSEGPGLSGPEPSATAAVDAPERERKLARALARAPLILPRAGIARERFDRWSREHGLRPRIAAESGGNEAVLAFARLGLGLALVPRIVVENGPFADGLAIYDGGPAFGDYDIGFVMRKAKTGSESSRRVRAAIAALLERAYPDGAWRAR
ncbi:MAG: LysR family transcriptional regulator [Spirochaetes bacterium]|nr:LysR family transcriptional regulator [Spirochaetota bacterium]MBU1080805.1 LysR family transcriptional regulator [Spirochaetota bacterium]